MSEETQTSTAGKGLGIAGFVLGLLALLFSFIPCLGMYAVFPGVIAIILAAVALMQANKGGAKKGLIIAALVVSVIGTGVAVWQYTVLSNALEDAGGTLEGIMDKAKEDMSDEEKAEFEDAMGDMEDAFEDALNEGEESEEDEY